MEGVSFPGETGRPRARHTRRLRPGTAVAGALILAVTLGGVLGATDDPPRPTDPPTGPRRLRLHHTHTEETIEIVYHDGETYLPDSLARLDHFLRDFRTDEVHAIDPGALDILWQLAHSVENPEGVYEIISAYRSPKTNENLRDQSGGVARNSQHLQGKAIDVRLRGTETETLRDAALNMKRGGVGYYRSSDFVHVDTGRVRRW